MVAREIDLTKDYTTPKDAPKEAWRRAWPELGFYQLVASIVLNANRLANAGLYDDKAWVNSSLATLNAVERLGGMVTIRNPQVFSQFAGPCVIIGNHMSTLETFILASIIQPQKPVTFIVKKSLVDYPLFGPIMRSRDPVVVGRTNPREDLVRVLQEGLARLQQGRSIIVFPQTTRSVVFDIAEFNSIGVKLAKKANVPVVPLALKTDFWGNGSIVKDLGLVNVDSPVNFSFGEPIKVESSGKTAQEQVTQFITNHLRSWGVAVKLGETVST